ncbi:MAG: hypothetical protein ACI9GW_002418, partial [Halieaceae bacterium]
MQHFRLSFAFTALCLVLAWWWGVESSKSIVEVMTLVVILGILEISLSFDNAVVNASVLKDMDEKWQRRFLTWGILIAVFGMRLVFPVLIVAVIAGLGPSSVIEMALHHPEEYAHHLETSHVQVAAFGGTFLLLIFLTFIFDESKTLHWLGAVEAKLAAIGKLESVEIIIALLVLLVAQMFLPVEQQVGALTYGLSGVVLFVLIDSLSSMLNPESAEAVKRGGAMGFIYLEVLDASFSFDGVLGAFAITNDIVIIMLGLAIGAMYVRSMTIFLVSKGTLEEYAFLEHGAHYAIGALAIIMLITMTI